jgi:NADH-quinone oxidoreductase subunit F
VRGGWDNPLAVIPGGASVPVIPKSVCDDVLMDFDSLREARTGLGTAAVIVMDKSTDIIKAIARLSKFYMHESCGQCTPCRAGTEKAALLMEKPKWNVALLDELSQAMRDASICGLGQAASNPLTSVIKYFPDEFKDAAE